MLNIFSYTDYRVFLQDYYFDAKKRNHRFSYEILSNLFGLKSKGFIRNVIKGERNISNENILKIAKALKFNKQEVEYFETLVSFNQAKNLDERNLYFTRLSASRGRGWGIKEIQTIKNDQFEFYSKYYHSVIRALIDIGEFKDDYKWLSKQVVPRITPFQAKKSIQLLEKLHLIKKNSEGYYQLVHKHVTTPDEVKSLALLNFHVDTGKLALKAIATMPSNKRNVSGITMGVSSNTYKTICDEIIAFRHKLAKIAADDPKTESVYRLNIQLFPVSESDIGKEK